MTPPPATAAATGHARALRRGTGPRGPRRVSGPARTPKGRSAGAGRSTAAAAAQQLSFEQARLGGSVALPAPRRVRAPRPVRVPHPGLARRLGGLVEHSWLDRLLRSRVWIAIVAVGLIGLVFMQVSLLKLNAGMGGAVERSAVLERDNAALRAEVSNLENNDRIQRLALEGGMVLPDASQVSFLGRNGKRVGGKVEIPSEAAATTPLPTVAGAAEAAAGATTAAPAATAPPAATPTTVTPTAATPTAAPAATTATTPPAATPTAPAPTPTATPTATPGAASAPTSAGTTAPVTGGAVATGGATATGG